MPAVTVLIPTHHRHNYLGRILDAHRGQGHTVLVTDSTDVPYAGDLDGVEYLHRPGLEFVTKLREAVHRVTTPYMVMRADNRHTIPAAIDQCAEFLEKSPGFATAHGAYVAVERDNDHLWARPNYHEDGLAGYLAESPAKRIMDLWRPYIPLFYAVTRTEYWREILDAAATGITNYHSLEIMSAIGLTAPGKSAHLPCLYSAIQIARRVAPKSAVYDDFALVAREPRYAEEYRLLRESLIAIMAEHLGQDLCDARGAVEDSLALYLREYCTKAPKRTFSQDVAHRVRKIARKLKPGRKAAGRAAHADELAAYLDQLDDQATARLEEMLFWLDSWKNEA